MGGPSLPCDSHKGTPALDSGLPPPPPANMARDAASSDSSFRSLYEIEPEAEGQGQRVEGRPCHVSSHASSDHLSSVQ